MLINLRNALMSGKRLPYDAEVEYLQSSGTQWIDTGVKPTSDTQVEITYKQPAAQSNVAIFGSRTAYNDRSYCIWTNANGYIRFDYSPTGSYSNANGPSSVVGDFVVVKKNGRQNFVNGTEYTANTAATFTCVGNAYLFAINNNGTADFKLSAQISACKIYDANGVLVRDYIPVRKGTVGYLYDRVSGALFGNAGTGDFVLGPDVVPVEYIESHGTEWIDTGVVPNDMTGFRVDAMARGSNDNVRVLGVYEPISGQNQRFAAVLRSAGSNTQEYYFGWGAAYNFIAGESNFDKRRLMELNYLNSRKMAFDGTIVQSNLPTLPTFTTSAYLFGNRNATPLIAMRCYQCQMSEGSSLSRSYYPIRVGTEGAMMDVLTRRIYRNAGTGAFAYGNDLKYPIPAS